MSPQRARRTSEKLTHSQKLSLYMRDNFTCVWCLTHYPEENLSVDHVIPRYLGVTRQPGHSKIQECVTACVQCNRARASKSVWKFANIIEKASRRNNRYPVLLRAIGRKNKNRSATSIMDYVIKQLNKPVYQVYSIRRMILDYKENNNGKT